MQKGKFIRYFVYLLLLTSVAFAETILIKNATIYLPGGGYQAESFIVVKGSKIATIGAMKDLAKMIPDKEFDVAGQFVYPAFIDSYYTDLIKKPKKAKSASAQRSGPGGVATDKTTRKGLNERKFLIATKAVDMLNLNQAKIKKLIASGFTFLQIVPENGIIAGTTSVISLSSTQPRQAVLVAERYLTLLFKNNSGMYPTTSGSLVAGMFQLKEDVNYYQKMKKLHHFDKTKRLSYQPELDILLPYFKNKKQFLIVTKNRVQQRMSELITNELKITPVLVANPDIWRRKVNPKIDVILPLRFKAPMSSIYASQGDKAKKKAEKELYPKQLAEFFKKHRRVSLSAPSSGDYKTLFKNIQALIKQGISEADIIRSLTVTPAKLLNISRFCGTLQAGKLASFFIADKKVFEDKSKISKVFVEGELFEFEAKKGKTKPPAKNLTGSWNVKIDSQMGNFELKMTVQQEGNEFTAELTSPMGKIDVQNGQVSGDEVTFSASAPIGGQDTTMEFSGKIKGDKIEGTMTIGSFGDAEFVATPEQALED